ncbi:hypothetical protein CHLRE_01g001950v5 [Chlamydomonas reinhardtii]|uniref:Uncharacterized protein n=1 Tax=Chlamydomonas reinhardtii TaxID=3055 RepID=A0A2K3E4R7_CHLRE|nr:uncharacterized protein CHLRE_01g001950v5 [Chlamydomonas reinhardtii]PNW87780.1 hypothetical protein CHLRE_01g001950v5 [Chlamydomonas reinhardtii]
MQQHIPPAPPAAAAPAPAPKSNIVSGALQSVFLLLLGAALALTGAKRQWDVFGVLLAAASVQLGGQLAKWLGSGSGGSGGGNGHRRGAGTSSRTPRGGRGGGSGSGSGSSAAAVVGPGGAAEGIRAHPVALRPDLRMGGVWVKDAARSDSMDAAVAAMRLNGLVRTAIRLIRGLELDPAALAAGRFDMAIFSIIAWFKVRESYPLDGTVGYFNRRDLRRGKHAASVCVQPDGSLILSVSWGEPLAGTGTDHFVLVPAAAAATAAAAAAASEPAAAAGGGPGAVGSSAGSVSGSTAGVYVGGGGAGAGGREANPGDLLVVTSSIRLAGGGAPVTYRTVYVRGGHHHHHHQQQQQEHSNGHQKRQHQPNPRAQLT